MFALFVGGFAFEESMGHESDPKAFGEYLASLPPEQFPTLTALAGDLIEGGADERFEFSIELLVRGLEAMAGSSRRTKP
jgi:hypothetical protein